MRARPRVPEARILVVDPDAERRSRLAARLAATGFSIDQIGSGFAALTSIERAMPHVVVMRWDSGEMNAVDLWSAMRHDDTLGRLRSVLVLGPNDGPEPQAIRSSIDGSFDLVIDGTEPLEDRLADLISGPSAVRTAPCRRPDQERPFSISGTGAFADITDIFQLIGARFKTGILKLGWDDEPAKVHFENGTVRHGSFRSQEGRAAMFLLFGELRQRGGAFFSFDTASPSGRVDVVPQTIGQPAQRILIDMAVALDETVQETGR